MTERERAEGEREGEKTIQPNGDLIPVSPCLLQMKRDTLRGIQEEADVVCP